MALLMSLWKRAKDLRLVKVSHLYCSPAESGQVIPSQSLSMLMQFRDFTLNCYHLGRVGAKYTTGVLSCKTLDLAVDGTYQEK